MIVIVDDNLDSCRVLARLLRVKGVPAECVTDPAAAIAVVEELKPDLLVLDQMMPGLSGTDLLRAIRGTPTLAATAAVFYSATSQGRDEARRLGALDWLIKGNTDWSDLQRRIIDVYKTRVAGTAN